VELAASWSSHCSEDKVSPDVAFTKSTKLAAPARIDLLAVLLMTITYYNTTHNIIKSTHGYYRTEINSVQYTSMRVWSTIDSFNGTPTLHDNHILQHNTQYN